MSDSEGSEADVDLAPNSEPTALALRAPQGTTAIRPGSQSTDIAFVQFQDLDSLEQESLSVTELNLAAYCYNVGVNLLKRKAGGKYGKAVENPMPEYIAVIIKKYKDITKFSKFNPTTAFDDHKIAQFLHHTPFKVLSTNFLIILILLMIHFIALFISLCFSLDLVFILFSQGLVLYEDQFGFLLKLNETYNVLYGELINDPETGLDYVFLPHDMPISRRLITPHCRYGAVQPGDYLPRYNNSRLRSPPSHSSSILFLIFIIIFRCGVYSSIRCRYVRSLI